MSTKEKAIELLDKFSKAEGDDFDFIGEPGDATMCWRMSRSLAKQCALIAVDELIAHSRNTAMAYDLSFDESENYWTKVKNEIELL